MLLCRGCCAPHSWRHAGWPQSVNGAFQLPGCRKAEHACARAGTALRAITVRALCNSWRTHGVRSRSVLPAKLAWIVLGCTCRRDSFGECPRWIVQGEAGTQWRRPRLLRLPGRSLIRVPLPGTPANSGPQQTGSRPSPLLSELGASGAGSSMVPSDASSDLLNWEKQVGSWEEDSPRSTADLSAETADELEAHARQLAAEVSQQGSEWEPLTASMDDSGAGGDLIAGMGSDSTAELADPRPLSQNDGLSKGNGTSTEADAEAKTLVPMWPLSLYPLSYRQDYSDADPQRTAGPSSAAEDALGEPISEPDLNSRPREKGGNQQQEMDASGVSKDSLGGNGAVADAVASLRSNASQPWQDESLPSSVSDDYTAAEQVSLQSEASTSALWRSRMSQAPDAAEKVEASPHAHRTCHSSIADASGQLPGV